MLVPKKFVHLLIILIAVNYFIEIAEGCGCCFGDKKKRRDKQPEKSNGSPSSSEEVLPVRPKIDGKQPTGNEKVSNPQKTGSNTPKGNKNTGNNPGSSESDSDSSTKGKKSPGKKSSNSKTDEWYDTEPLTMPNKTRSPAQVRKFKEKTEETFKNHINLTLQFTGESCAKGFGNLYKQNISGEVIYESCFNDDTKTIIYTQHMIAVANAVEAAAQKVERKDMETPWLFDYFLSTFDNEWYYKTKSQEAEFQKIYGMNQIYVSKDLPKQTYYAHGHLVPHADFHATDKQMGTYVGHNCAAEMQCVNNGHWKKLEEYGRALAEVNRPILAFTGVHGHLEYKVLSTGKKVEAYLDNENKRCVIPKMFWKLYVDEKTNDTLAFFSSNDPHLNDAEAKAFQQLCTCQCAEVGFKFNPNVIKSEVTVCCTYKDFVKIIDFLPRKFPKESKLLIKSKSRSPSPTKATK